MPNTRIPPEGTFAGYYREIETHEWYQLISQEGRDALNKVIIIPNGWGMCSCGSGAPLFQQEIHVGEGAFTRTPQRCKKCIRSKAIENTLVQSDFNALWNALPQHGSSALYQEIMPYSHFPTHATTRATCEVCSGFIFLADDLSVSERQVLLAIAHDNNGDMYTVHATCTFKCECDKIMIATFGYNSVNRNRVCGTCFDEYEATGDLSECGWCNQYYTETIFSDMRNVRLCGRCYDSSWECDDCGYEMYEDSSHECYRESDSIIYDYSYKPDPKFFGSDTHYFGIELEVEDNGRWGCESGAELVQNALGSRVYLKRDGSLDNGFEIVSHPHSFDEWKSINWDVLRTLRSKGFRSWDTNTCGLHVHVSRTAFRKYGKSDEAHELRFQKLIYDNGKQVRAIAGRSSSFARFNDKGALVPKVKFGHTADRYEAVNSQNDHTLEVRVFRGSLKPARILSAIEFIHSAIEYTRDMKIDPKGNQLSWVRFMGYVLDNKDKYENFAQIALSTLGDEPRDYESEEN